MYFRRLIRAIGYSGSHLRQLIALCVTALVLAGAWSHLQSAERLIAGWDAYAFTLLVLAWTRIASASPRTVVRVARLQHVHRMVIFLFVLAGACASLGGVAVLMATQNPGAFSEPVIAAALTIVLSWFLVHTVFALHYAYLTYRIPESRRVAGNPGALIFPGSSQPDYFDFAYFSFIIGMTSQVSDVQIASRHVRRWALLHGLISFAFNTAVLAFGINVVSGLLSANH
jgi:uncharacterized membrane protein